MSTVKQLAKEVWKQVFDKKRKIYKKEFICYETQNGQKFSYASQSAALEAEELYIIKYLPIHHSKEYRYEIYKVNKKEMYQPKYPKYLRWLGNQRFWVIRI